jgi:hypothetical protein
MARILWVNAPRVADVGLKDKSAHGDWFQKMRRQCERIRFSSAIFRAGRRAST